jgi:transcriptional regulator with XRE-family HTH domain
MAEDLYQYIGNKIRIFRTDYKMSQEDLAKKMKTTANTISRWETGVYQPTVGDLDKLARIFGQPIWAFFPVEVRPPTEAHQTLLSATGDLPKEDLEELQRYADFIRAGNALKKLKRTKKQKGKTS